MDLTETKQYILNMAKDLYMNTSFKGNDITRVLLRKIDIGGMRAGTISIFRNQRSITDPL
jgi:hypothetical protein